MACKVLYNKHFFKWLHQHMVKNELEMCMDASNTLWHVEDVEYIMCMEFGYRKASNGSLL